MWKGGEWVEELNADRLIAEKNNYGRNEKRYQTGWRLVKLPVYPNYWFDLSGTVQHCTQ